MSPLYTIAWLMLLIVAISFVFEFIGVRTMVKFFPGTKRVWHLPAQLGSLAFFALVVLSHPFK